MLYLEDVGYKGISVAVGFAYVTVESVNNTLVYYVKAHTVFNNSICSYISVTSGIYNAELALKIRNELNEISIHYQNLEKNGCAFVKCNGEDFTILERLSKIVLSDSKNGYFSERDFSGMELV